MEFGHTSVMAAEAAEWLAARPGGTYVDGTLGFGGHAGLILEKSAPDGRLVGLDKDEAALAKAREALKRFGDRAMLVHDDFKNVGQALKSCGISQVRGMLVDLGVSSMQLDDPARGFSFRAEGPLDMRMDVSTHPTAAEIVNQTPKEKLKEIIREYGEERFAGRIAERIDRERKARRIQSTLQLASIIESAVPGKYRHGRIHPATRTFQALRIAVNRELDSLTAFLDEAPGLLEEGGRLVVISFHSLEDRLVKRAFRALAAAGEGIILTKKPAEASDAEQESNPRSRSAKLRAFERRKGGLR